MLTRKQSMLLQYIAQYMHESDGVAPTFNQMAAGAGLKSKSGIHRMLTALEERGYVRRIHQRARCIEIIRLPGTVDPYQQLNDAIDRLTREAGAFAAITYLKAMISYVSPPQETQAA